MSTEKKIISVTLCKMYDEGQTDTSYLGRYTDRPEPYAIICQGEHAGRFVCDLKRDEELPHLGREYNYFIAEAGGETPGTKNYRRYALQDYGRMDALQRQVWWFVGIRAEAEIKVGGSVQTITSGGLWGIESDSGKAYFEQVEQDELGDLRQTLIALGFTKKQISTAYKDIERKDM